MFAITTEPIDPRTVSAAVEDERAGGLVTFVGTVRDFSRGRAVTGLHYEAFPEMAEKKFREIADEMRQRWPICKVAMVHRIGDLQIGAIAVVIAVSTPHRAEAFAACEYAIDRLKSVAPIWKKEAYHDGEVWVADHA